MARGEVRFEETTIDGAILTVNAATYNAALPEAGSVRGTIALRICPPPK
jgi:hypothetical protein